jgi:hypothetical protein
MTSPLPTVGGEHHPDTATVAGDRRALDQAGGLDAVHEPCQPTAGEERELLQLLHPETARPSVGEAREHVEPRQREAIVLDHVEIGNPEDPGAREKDTAPGIEPGPVRRREVVVRLHGRQRTLAFLWSQLLY